jgi:hypothetical protein
MGSPEMEWEPYWQPAKSLFPCWVGFRAERLEPKEEIIKFLKEHIRTAEDDMEILRNTDK